MKRFITVISAGLLVVLLAACGTQTTGSNTDTTAANNFLPSAGVFQDYQVTQADSLTEAITAAAGEGAAALDNAAIAAAVQRVDGFIDCYNEVGAVAANIYTQVDLGSILSSGSLVPRVGTVAVVNRDRVQENFVACAAQSMTQARTFSAQSDTGICQGSGEFSSGGDNFSYIFIATSNEFCQSTEQHFAGIS